MCADNAILDIQHTTQTHTHTHTLTHHTSLLSTHHPTTHTYKFVQNPKKSEYCAGKPIIFTAAISRWLGAQVKSFGIGFICLGVIQLACIFAAGHVMMNGGGDDNGMKAQKKKAQKKVQKKKKKKKNGQQGNELAKILFIIGLFIPIVGLINMCMHCGSPYAKARYWAKGSCIVFGIQILLVIVIVVVGVVMAGAAIASIAGSAQGCGFDVACLAKRAALTAKCSAGGAARGGDQAKCDAIMDGGKAACRYVAGMPMGGVTLPATCVPK